MKSESRNSNATSLPSQGHSSDSGTRNSLKFRVSSFELCLCLLLAVVTLLTFLPIRHHAFLQFDDPEYITENRMVQGGLTWSGVTWAFTTFHASNWHPLTWLSHMLDATLFGTSPAGPHLVNLLLHLANTALLFLLLRWLTGAVWPSALVAALFALHPLHVESVAWAAERKDVLSAFFFLLTLWAYGNYVAGGRCQVSGIERTSNIEHRTSTRRSTATEDGSNAECAGKATRQHPMPGLAGHAPRSTQYVIRNAQRGIRFNLWYGWALLLFTLGLMSKPMLVTLPFVLLLLDYWPLARVSVAACQVSGEKQRPNIQHPMPATAGHTPRTAHHAPHTKLPRLILEKAPFLLLSALSSAVTLAAQQSGGAVRSLAGIPMSDRVDNALVAFARYLGKTFWPTDLAVLYPHPGQWPRAQVLLSALLVAGLTLAALRFGRKFPFAATGWLWFCGMLIPVSGLVQAGGQSIADRYTYLPLIGMFIIVAWALGEIAARWPHSKSLIGLVTTLAVVACAAQTRAQLHFWRDSESLFRQAIAVTKSNATAHNNLGGILLDTGRVDEAMTHYERALAIQPDYADAHNNLGNALLQKGRVDEALDHFHVAVELQPGDASARNNLGNALLSAGRLGEAIPQYEEALKLQPNFAKAHNNLGWSLLQTGRLDEALAHFQKALEVEPDYANAHNNLGFALLRKGRVREAIAHCQTAVKLQPDDAGTLSNLAWLLATSADPAVRDGGQATTLAERANRLSGGREPAVLRALAAAYAEGGRFADACATAQQALQLAESQSNAALAEALRVQLQSYQADLPFREDVKPETRSSKSE